MTRGAGPVSGRAHGPDNRRMTAASSSAAPLSRPPAAGPYAELATVERNGFIESRHFGSMVTLAADGTVHAALGVPDEPTMPRSALKPLQATVCLEAGAALEGSLLALAAASHLGQDEHVAGVREILASAGLAETALQCPPDVPGHAETRRRLIREGEPPSRIRMNCSGKHAAMLAACVASGWPTETYRDPAHPLQQRIAALIGERAGEALAHTGVDGCGAPAFALSLTGLARAVRSVVTATPGSADRAVADAMRAHPFYVAGTGHVNTAVMEAMPGVLCKGGAEGVIVAVAASGATVAVKVIDGSARATTLIALAGLQALGENTAAAAALTTVPVLGAGEPVGVISVSRACRDALGR